MHITCGLNAAQVSLHFLPFSNGSKDSVAYDCHIESSSDRIYLIWTITFAGHLPIEIMFNGSSTPNVEFNSGLGVSAVLKRQRSGMHIDSRVTISLIESVVVNCKTDVASAEETLSMLSA